MQRFLYGALIVAALQALLLLSLQLRPGKIAIYLWLLGPGVLFVVTLIVFFIGLLYSLMQRSLWSWRQGVAFLFLALTLFISQVAYKGT